MAKAKSNFIADFVQSMQSTKHTKSLGLSLYAPMNLMSRIRNWTTLGIPSIDRAMGGGIPHGRILEIFGPESAGKTAFTHLAIARFHRTYPEGVALLIETEMTTEATRLASYAKKGFDPSRLLYQAPDTLEQLFDGIEQFLDALIAKKGTKSPALIVWDSVAASSAKAERAKESLEDVTVGVHAKVIATGIRKILSRVPRSNVAILIVNQERDDIGAYAPMGMKPKTTPGGKAIKYYATHRIHLQPKGYYPATGDRRGRWVRFKVLKNKVVIPGQVPEIFLDYSAGFDPVSDLLYVAIQNKIIRGIGDGQFQISPKLAKQIGGDAVSFELDGWRKYYKSLTPATRQALKAQVYPEALTRRQTEEQE